MSGILNQGLPGPLPQQSLDLSTYPTTPLQQFGLFILIIFPAISVLLVSLRLYDRIKGNAFGLDDAFISVATVWLPSGYNALGWFNY